MSPRAWRLGFLLLAAGAPAIEAAESVSAAHQHLRLSADARPAALGGAFAAIAEGPAGLAINPAGLARVEDLEASLSHLQLYGDLAFESLSLALPLEGQGLGASLRWLNTPAFNSTDDPAASEAGEQAYAVTLGWGFDMGHGLGLGAAAKGFYDDLGKNGSAGAALDLGALWRLRNSGFTLGVAARQLGGTNSYRGESETLPMTLRTALAWRAPADGPPPFTLALDLERVLGSPWRVQSGLEWRPLQAFALRGGWQQSEGEGFTGLHGFSAGFGAELAQATLDYALSSHALLGLSHRLSLSWRFLGELQRVDEGALFWSTPLLVPAPGEGLELRLNHRLEAHGDRVRQWWVEIRDASGRPLAQFSGRPPVPESLTWDLLPSAQPAADAPLFYRIRLRERTGISRLGEGRLTRAVPVDTLELALPLLVRYRHQGAWRLETHLNVHPCEVLHWKLDIYGLGPEKIGSLSGDDDLPEELGFAGKDAAGRALDWEAPYRFDLEVRCHNARVLGRSGFIAKALQPREFMARAPAVDTDLGLLVFKPSGWEQLDPREWHLDIKAPDGRILRTLRGRGQVPTEIRVAADAVLRQWASLEGQGLRQVRYVLEVKEETGDNHVVSEVVELPALKEDWDTAGRGTFKAAAGVESLVVSIPSMVSAGPDAALPVSVKFAGKATPKSWVLLARDAKGAVVRTWQGPGPLPEAVVWDGTDDAGKAVAGANECHFELQATYADGRRAVTPGVAVRRAFSVAAGDWFIRKIHAAWFDHRSTALRPDMARRLSQLAEHLKKNPSLKLLLQGHASRSGDDETNRKLSDERALRVRRFFEEAGLDPARMELRGYGKRLPLDPGDTPEAARLNRRVDLLIMEKAAAAEAGDPKAQE